MDDALRVRVLHRPRDLDRIVERLIDLEPTAGRDDRLEGFARDVLHHDEENVVLLLRRRDRDDVRMVECGQQARFPQQFAEVQILAVRDLERDLLVDPGIFGQIDVADSSA